MTDLPILFLYAFAAIVGIDPNNLWIYLFLIFLILYIPYPDKAGFASGCKVLTDDKPLIKSPIG